jgi:hypothetical protein
VAAGTGDLWIATGGILQKMAPQDRVATACVQLHRLRAGATSAASDAPGPVFPGTDPSLVSLPDGKLLLVLCDHRIDGETHLVARRGTADGVTWSDPLVISSRADSLAPAFGKPFVTRQGTILVPEIWHPAGDGTMRFACHRSLDAGATWRSTTPQPLGARPAGGAVLAEPRAGEILLVARRGSDLVRCTSRDEGTRWTAPARLQLAVAAAPFALTGDTDRTLLVYTTPVDADSMAPPVLRPLRCAVSTDAGKTWRPTGWMRAWPGSEPAACALVQSADRRTLLYEDRRGGEATVSCVGYGPERFVATASPPPPDAGSAPYGCDPLRAREALRVLAAHTVLRPQRSKTLFVEGYYMRSLVRAFEVLSASGDADADGFDARRGLDKAIAWADTLVSTQDKFGRWPLGYEAVWYADMGAAAAVFAAVEPYVDSLRLQGYERAAERLLADMGRNKMFLPGGALSLGWPLIVDHLGNRIKQARDPYLVSTALVGIELRGWLFHRTGNEEYRRAALESLDYTLSRIGPAGFTEPTVQKEGELRIAGYVEEGWMAADVYLQDPSVLQRLQKSLPRHVDWVLKQQNAAGFWDDGKGSTSRTVSIVNFLVWYDQRCGSRRDVREAIRRAMPSMIEPEGWQATGLYRSGARADAMRALLGRSLAAVAGGRWVL